ncbi:2-amino-4-hydroxy-6-hydroxymethyldihydropteridine diphosphokinase [Alteromonas sp. ASW11-130]|uniref:2-amino-4-hydroxy-6- hydroxymethyldihydropteridine diphosphokinase n=1 Tax=Alteromonas sp. ASW11-130 TaxID=3015775 RepID=UPI0022423064|nr:2-amino-4-hydroxy-6-hydroxymethyldihydropteridine diphosphokinase [Alteromonas sp. ASW11-130]MCW8090503.1 2-amino-4-hydroxy-6-hydroxymethyldihydropteridine diphosphokinase [Alteromonas sp. ASW11-130]
MTHTLLISIGTNINRAFHVRAARKALEAVFEDVKVSDVYESEAVGFDGEAFYNLVASAKTTLDLYSVCTVLKKIESANGRKHNEKKFCSRTLDLDLLTYDDVCTEKPTVLPREEILFNAFVLLPLANLVPDWHHPQKKQSYQALWQAFDQSSQQLKPINFNWSP